MGIVLVHLRPQIYEITYALKVEATKVDVMAGRMIRSGTVILLLLTSLDVAVQQLGPVDFLIQDQYRLRSLMGTEFC